jgi:hypothetical protein
MWSAVFTTEVVLDDDHGVALRDQLVQHVEQPLNVGEVEAVVSSSRM